MVTMEKNRHASPKINLVGRDLRKSSSAYRAVRIPKNSNTDIEELNIDSPFEIMKMRKTNG